MILTPNGVTAKRGFSALAMVVVLIASATLIMLSMIWASSQRLTNRIKTNRSQNLKAYSARQAEIILSSLPNCLGLLQGSPGAPKQLIQNGAVVAGSPSLLNSLIQMNVIELTFARDSGTSPGPVKTGILSGIVKETIGKPFEVKIYYKESGGALTQCSSDGRLISAN